MRHEGEDQEGTRVRVSFFFAEATRQRNDLMDQKEDEKEVELAKRGVEARIDRANQLHHQGRHAQAFKQLELAHGICIRRLGPQHEQTERVNFIMKSMREDDGSLRGPTPAELHFDAFDGPHAALGGPFRAQYELARIMRRKAFVEEAAKLLQREVPFDAEIDAADTAAGVRHVLGLVGDAPIVYARWRLDGDVAVVDRLCTIEDYRRRGIARHCLQAVARDVTAACAPHGLAVSALAVLVPCDASDARVQASLETPAHAQHYARAPDMLEVRGLPCVRVVLHAAPIVAAADAVAAHDAALRAASAQQLEAHAAAALQQQQHMEAAAAAAAAMLPAPPNPAAPAGAMPPFPPS